MTTKPAPARRPLYPVLSIWEKLDFLPAGLSLLATILYNAISGAFRGKSGARTYKLHLARAVIQKLVMRLSFRQSHWLIPATDHTYKDWLRGKGRQTGASVPLKHGAVGHWVGDKNAKNVIVYYHGGGFHIPGSAGHFTYYSQLLTNLNESGHDAALFFLSYTLTPTTAYPTQLTQAVDALHHILTNPETPRSPSNIFLGGDSAGGNLAVAVLEHISHQHPEIDSLLPYFEENGEELGGVFAIAPWVSFRTDGITWPSMSANAYKDIIVPEELSKWSAAYLNGRYGDSHSEPLLAPEEWWAVFRAKKFLITAGEDEILRSPIEAFAEKVRAGAKAGGKEEDVTFVVGEGESHVPMVFGDDPHTQQGDALEMWLIECLS